MIFEIEKDLELTDLADKLGEELGVTLRATNPNDVVHGYLNKFKDKGRILVELVFYDKDEAPNESTGHTTTFKRYIPKPEDGEKVVKFLLKAHKTDIVKTEREYKQWLQETQPAKNNTKK